MDHSVNAKVIITLFDLYFYETFFHCTQEHAHTYTDTQTNAESCLTVDEQAARGGGGVGVRGLTELPSF